MNLPNIILTERSQIEKPTYGRGLFIWNVYENRDEL